VVVVATGGIVEVPSACVVTVVSGPAVDEAGSSTLSPQAAAANANPITTAHRTRFPLMATLLRTGHPLRGRFWSTQPGGVVHPDP
jgi:hypothetical protein